MVWFITCMGAHFSAVELDNAIRFSTLPGCQGSCGIVPNGHAAMPGLEVLARSLDTDLRYVTTMLQFLNDKVKLWQLLGRRCSNFLGLFS